jgi:hypothetical protein
MISDRFDRLVVPLAGKELADLICHVR